MIVEICKNKSFFLDILLKYLGNVELTKKYFLVFFLMSIFVSAEKFKITSGEIHEIVFPGLSRPNKIIRIMIFNITKKNFFYLSLHGFQFF